MKRQEPREVTKLASVDTGIGEQPGGHPADVPERWRTLLKTLTRGAWIHGLPSLNQAEAVASAKWFCHSHSAALYQVLMGTHHIILQQTEASNSQKYFLQFSQSIYM